MANWLLSIAAFAADTAPGTPAPESGGNFTFKDGLALLGVLGAVFNFWYTNRKAKTTRASDQLRANFVASIQSPAELILNELEDSIQSLEASFLDRRVAQRRKAVSELLKNHLVPLSQRLDNILRRADGLECVDGNDWAAFADTRFDDIWAATDKICNPASPSVRMEEGRKEAVEALRNLCLDIRNRMHESLKKFI